MLWPMCVFRRRSTSLARGTESQTMKRFASILLLLGLMSTWIGCPSGEETPEPGTEAGAAATTGGAATTSAGGQFKEGVDSGRAADGSDEDK